VAWTPGAVADPLADVMTERRYFDQLHPSITTSERDNAVEQIALLAARMPKQLMHFTVVTFKLYL
jgi:hypothetical protein